MRRVLPLAWAAVILAGSSCVDLTRPKVDSGAAGKDGGVDGEPPADGGDEDRAPVTDANPEAAEIGDAPVEAPTDAARDTGVDLRGDVRSTLGDGLVGYWKLDESSSATTAVDSSGMGNDGQIMGNPGRVSTGLPPVSFTDRGAFSFAGQSASDDGIRVPDDNSLRPTAITIALWVRFASLSASSTCGAASSQLQYLVERRNTRGSQGMFEAVALMKQVDGTITFLLSSNAGAQAFATSKTSLAAQDVGKWFHIVGTYDGSSWMQIYVNGVSERKNSYSAAIDYDPSRPLFIGRTGECGGSGEATWDARLNGTLDDVRIYDRALTADEVAQLAAGGD